jgi:type III pantothenate kinase
MRLLVDIGNSSVKWALQQRRDGPLQGFNAALHNSALPLDLLARWDELDGIDSVLAAGVGPQAVRDAVAQVCVARFGCNPHWVQTRAEAFGIRIAYALPERLGVDRFLALVAAHDCGQAAPQASASLIVDAGTAVTYDLLSAEGRHLGGLILPGIRLMRDSLLSGTQIPRTESTDADPGWATDTGAAIAAASIQAPAALAERLYSRLQQRPGDPPPRLILTGGDTERLAAAIAPPTECIPDLVLRGLGRFPAD